MASAWATTMQTALGPQRVWDVEPFDVEHEIAEETPSPSPLQELLTLTDDEIVLLRQQPPPPAPLLVLTDGALYEAAAAKSGGSMRSLFSSVATKSPRERTGFQEWKHEATLISRVDLSLIESAEAVEEELRISVPRSAIPSKLNAGASGATRAMLVYRASDASACRLLLLAVQHAARTYWQEQLEVSLLHSPEIYASHARAKEVPRKGAPLSRLLILSDQRVYSAKRDGLSLHAASDGWAAALADVASLEQLELKEKRLPGYPYGLVLRWTPSTPGAQHASSEDAPGRPKTVFALKSREDLVRLTACALQLHGCLGGSTPTLAVVELA